MHICVFHMVGICKDEKKNVCPKGKLITNIVQWTESIFFLIKNEFKFAIMLP